MEFFINATQISVEVVIGNFHFKSEKENSQGNWVCTACYGDSTTATIGHMLEVVVDSILMRRVFDTPAKNIFTAGIDRLNSLVHKAR